jgi:hypothetical protein
MTVVVAADTVNSFASIEAEHATWDGIQARIVGLTQVLYLRSRRA